MWNGFWHLSNTRPVGYDGALRILISEIEAYTRLQGYDFLKAQEFLMYMERMDNIFMEHVYKLREEADRKNKSSENKSKEIRPKRRR